jgi:hypothetical protein
MKSILRSADFQSGLMFITLAGLGLWQASGLRGGTAMRMGPGYLPTLICYILIFLGLATIGLALARPETATERWYMRPLVGVSAGLLVFAFGIERIGLFVTTVLLVIVSSLATPESRWIEVIAVAVGLAAFSTALFVAALGLPIPSWPQVIAF